jgi:hypothetical protein
MPKETMMRFYNQAHGFYCGVDLHARTMYLCILDQAGTIVFSARFVLNSSPEAWVSWLLAAAHDHGLAIPPGLHPSFGYRDAPYRLPTLRDVLLHFLLEFLGALGLNNEIPHSLTSTGNPWISRTKQFSSGAGCKNRHITKSRDAGPGCCNEWFAIG